MAIQVSLISATDVQGKTFTHDLQKPIVVFTGKNGAGKTTRLKAVDLALRGPRKDDNRFGDKASVHMRLKVPADIHPGARIEVLRGLSPKHTIALQPLVAQGSKSVTVAQGQLDSIVQMPSVTFDLDAFTGLSADKQKSALMPFARFIPATQYADVYPAVVPFEGEAGSDYLSRVRAAISEECKALAARKQAAERAQAELANQAEHNARTADVIRIDISATEQAIANAAKYTRLNDDLRVTCQHVEGAKAVLQQADARLQAALGTAAPAYTGKTSAQLREELNQVEAQLAIWTNWLRWDGDRQRAAADVQAARQRHEQAVTNLDGAGGAEPYDAQDEARVQEILTRQQRLLSERDAALQQLTRAQEELAGVRELQLEPLALICAIEAAVLNGGGGEPTAAHVRDLRSSLLLHGFPNAPKLEADARRTKGRVDELSFEAGQIDAPALQARGWTLQRARSAASVRASLVQARDAASIELSQREAYASQVNAAQPQEPDGDSTKRLLLMQRKTGVDGELQFALQAERSAAGVDTARQQAEQDVANARAKLQAAEEAELKARETMASAAPALVAVQPPVPSEQLHEHLAALRRELDDATRAEGKVQAEREAYQNAEQAKQSLDAAKAAEKRAKEASDKCLRESLGAVAEVFQPFCALLGGSWRLGDERPLGLERDGQWIDFEHLSESERLVYGIGLVLALSTLGKGLRLVMLDGLDSCDVDRRRAIVGIAAHLIAAGKLDNVLGTAWSQQGFEDASVQVVEV